MTRSLVRTLALVTAAVAVPLLSPNSATAQLIPVKSVPVAAGDQFLLLPSDALAMGGLTLALDDPLADGWSNPAKGVLLTETRMLASPTLYRISGHNGGGSSFPLATLVRGERWFGAVAFALQQVRDEAQDGPVPLALDLWIPGVPQPRLSDQSARNLYAQAFVGARLGDGPWSLGLGLSGASLDAMDGVDLLYANASRIEQNGSTADVRVGLYRDGVRDRLSLILVHDRVDMTHDVQYQDFIWIEPGQWLPYARSEINHDRTRTWGGQVGWDRDLQAPGWRVGAVATVNRKSHPSIPNYDLQNIPRDPGITWAWEAGIGVARSEGPTRLGAELLVQPIWSETWQEALDDVVTLDGGFIPRGGRTVENNFFFTDIVLRTGVSHAMGDVQLQGGLEVRSIGYSLRQWDRVQVNHRRADEGWMEWSPSVGAVIALGDVELRYAGRLTTGTGRPGVTTGFLAVPALADSDFLVAPSGPLTLQDAHVFTHQIAVSVPLR